MIDHELGPAARAMGVAVDAEAWARLEALVELWLRYARAINLTGARTRPELLPHLSDGLATLAVVERVRTVDGDTRWLDVGSGAGFPALVVAACRPVDMTMLEPRERRAAFLELASRVGGSGNCVVRRARIESSTWSSSASTGVEMPNIERFDVLTSRAVFDPVSWLELGKTGLRPGGVIVAHGDVETVPTELALVATLEAASGALSAYRAAETSAR